MRSSSYFKTISQILILAMLHLCWLTSYGYAEMIPTETAIHVQDDRQRILDLLDNQEVVEELEKYGISKVEATVRINSLSDEEVTKIAGKLDKLVAGAGFGRSLARVLLFVPAIILDLILALLRAPWCFIPPFHRRSECLEWPITSALFSESDNSPEVEVCKLECKRTFPDCKKAWGLTNTTSESQCEEKKQACFQRCEGEEESDAVPAEEDCDPGMESCD